MLKSIGFRKEEEIPCLFNYGGKLGQTTNVTFKYSLFSVLKNTNFLNFKCTFKPKDLFSPKKKKIEKACVREFKL